MLIFLQENNQMKDVSVILILFPSAKNKEYTYSHSILHGWKTNLIILELHGTKWASHWPISPYNPYSICMYTCKPFWPSDSPSVNPKRPSGYARRRKMIIFACEQQVGPSRYRCSPTCILERTRGRIGAHSRISTLLKSCRRCLIMKLQVNIGRGWIWWISLISNCM